MSESDENRAGGDTGNGYSRQIRQEGSSSFRFKFLIRILAVIVLFVILMLLTIYGATVIANFTESFPVKVVGEGGGVSLCASPEMGEPTSHLEIPVPNALDNISEFTIADDVDRLGGGSHNGDNYIAYTFYAKNNVGGDLPISEKITLISSSKHAEEALRVRLYRDGVITTYAKQSAAGTPEYGTVPFVDDKTVLSDQTVLHDGQIIRYTVVIWIEGNDPECVNEICGGSVRLSMEFSASEP